ncbi:hypothetical protein OBBRIDRAFT_836846 [Obba rivulosa]|uniref:Uncharacterized protein n=1 Tax=Obba rivulosa TaxID=1052685 RepID=A0A8E2ANS4_9APHY|nr:hypothetical protein OBBRIDRAFT_836846 [Obba rivulosa]
MSTDNQEVTKPFPTADEGVSISKDITEDAIPPISTVATIPPASPTGRLNEAAHGAGSSAAMTNGGGGLAHQAGPGMLTGPERWWRDRQTWLEERGYILRSRYRPAWKPSWEGTRKEYGECEDGLTPLTAYALDAVRIYDQRSVMLKKISKSLHPHEVEIGQFFSAEP